MRKNLQRQQKRYTWIFFGKKLQKLIIRKEEMLAIIMFLLFLRINYIKSWLKYYNSPTCKALKQRKVIFYKSNSNFLYTTIISCHKAIKMCLAIATLTADRYILYIFDSFWHGYFIIETNFLYFCACQDKYVNACTWSDYLFRLIRDVHRLNESIT